MGSCTYIRAGGPGGRERAQVPGAHLEIFEEEESGNHFMFIEGHQKFNDIVADFVG